MTKVLFHYDHHATGGGQGPVPQDERETVAGWLRSNGLNPDLISADDPIYVQQDDDGLVLVAREFDVDDNGETVLCPRCTACVASHEVQVPLAAYPPDLPNAYVHPDLVG